MHSNVFFFFDKTSNKRSFRINEAHELKRKIIFSKTKDIVYPAVFYLQGLTGLQLFHISLY